MATSTLPERPRVISPAEKKQTLRIWIYSASVFLGAFLLFQVQLIAGRSILPWFGGTVGVWATCLLFFQLLLLAGYAYAHWISSRLPHGLGVKIHAALLAASVLLLLIAAFFWRAPILPGDAWKPQGTVAPVFAVLGLLSLCVGFPFLLLSTTSPLVQNWYSRSYVGASPYRLYALSNVGSLLGLLSYPLVLEPALNLTTQAWLWCAGYGLYVAFMVVCGRQSATAHDQAPVERTTAGSPTARPGWKQFAMWIALAACASTVLLGVTETICQEIAVVPLLWVLPLCVYLLSFIISFEHERWYRREFFHLLLAAVVVGILIMHQGSMLVSWTGASFLLLTLFACCMLCHGEIYRSRPSSEHLTAFYLSVSLGGVLGGLFVNLIAPLIFSGYWELHLGVFACFLAMVWLAIRDKQSWVYRCALWLPLAILLWGYWVAQYTTDSRQPAFGAYLAMWQTRVLLALTVLVSVLALFRVRLGKESTKYGDTETSVPRLTAVALVLGAAFVGANLWQVAGLQYPQTVWSHRNFYGVLHVQSLDMKFGHYKTNLLRHGQIRHGLQMQTPELRRVPTSYFGRESGIGLMLLNHPHRQLQPRVPLRVGIIGLGVGTLAAYGEPGDLFRFYEINPAVTEVAADSGYFTFLRDSFAKVQVIEGDARISLENELKAGQPQQYDMLVIDAFNSDSIPVHLLTKEAFQLYLQHLRGPDSVIAVHISNNMLKLAPVVTRLASHFHLYSAHIFSEARGDLFSASVWMLLTANPKTLQQPAILKASSAPPERNIRLWTDEYSSVLRLF